MATELADIGDCWHCDRRILVPEKYRAHADTFQMLFCSQKCADASRRAGKDYGRGLIIKLSADINPADFRQE